MGVLDRSPQDKGRLLDAGSAHCALDGAGSSVTILETLSFYTGNLWLRHKENVFAELYDICTFIGRLLSDAKGARASLPGSPICCHWYCFSSPAVYLL